VSRKALKLRLVLELELDSSRVGSVLSRKLKTNFRYVDLSEKKQ